MSQFILGLIWVFSPIVWVVEKLFGFSTKTNDVVASDIQEDLYSSTSEEDRLEDLRLDRYTHFDPTDEKLFGPQ